MLAAVSTALALFLALPLCAQESGSGQNFEARARLASPLETSAFHEVTSPPFELADGSSLIFVSPYRWVPLARRLAGSLSEIHRTLSILLGEIPAFSSSIRLMEEEAFFTSTGAPRWTNAMYYRGQIVIPLSISEPADEVNLSRSLRHEYTHALIHSLSGGRCPGWIDEGMAQWAEGEENPALQPALRNWLRNEPPVSFGLLQGGFTRLQPQMVPAAYAQSLFATNTLLRIHGFKTLRRYLDELHRGTDAAIAFRLIFNQSESSFEKQLSRSMIAWSRSSADQAKR